MIVDACAYFGPALANYRDILMPLYDVTTPEKLLVELDRVGIDLAIVRAPRWVGGPVFDPSYEKANLAVREATARFPRRLLGYGRVNPNWGPAAVEEAERCLRDYGLRGLMLDPEWENFNPTDRHLVYPLLELARRYRVPVMFHSGYHPAQPALFWDVALDFSDVPVILAHMGERLTADALIVASKVRNIYLETSNHMYLLWACVRGLGPQRVLFGTSLPFSDPEAEKLKITHRSEVTVLHLSDEEQAMVLGGSAAQLHGLS
jgi:predicted TIM-barrel fold metal-dependent hydrolase